MKKYANQTIQEINGPITVVSGKKRRITFMECNNELTSMIDVAKVADLVLLMIDASFGFEMVCANVGLLVADSLSALVLLSCSLFCCALSCSLFVGDV